MSHSGVILPVLQNWSCHNCGGCCREHQISISEQERQRISAQRWTAEDGIPSDRPLMVPLGTGFRLNQMDDGACVFLDDRGLCRIHAKFGEAAKPLACQAYPYAIHPAGNSVTVSLRFSCPSVVQNLGQPVHGQRAFLERIANQIVPKEYNAPDAPELRDGHPLNWPDVIRILAFLDRGLADSDVGFATRLMRILSWLDLAEGASSDALSGERLGELLRLLHEASVRAQPDDDLPVIRPSRVGTLMFRQLIAQLLRHDTDAMARRGLFRRLEVLGVGLRYTLGIGRVPELKEPASVQVAFPRKHQSSGESGDSKLPPGTNQSPRFRDLEEPFGGRNREFDEVFSRYFRVKVQGIHFCGAAYYHMNMIDGFRSLALMYPATLWVSRMLAARDGRKTVDLNDVQAALATLDHNFGYSAVFALKSSRQRIRQLSRLLQITALCGWYSL